MPTDYSRHRLGELIELALDGELLEGCYVAKDSVVITMCGRKLTFPPVEARVFLSSLLQGLARTQSPTTDETIAVQPPAAPTATPPPPDVRRRSIFTPLPHLSAASGMTVTPSSNGTPGDAATDEAYVDAVLACAEKLHLIEGYNKDRASHRVTLRTKATTTDMSYFETLEYLTGSILEELRVDNRS